MDDLTNLDLDLILDKRGDMKWERRLSPMLDISTKDEYDKIFHDRCKKKDLEPNEDDKKIIEEQKETGKSIDKAYIKEQFLRNNNKELPLNDYRNILYRLPISEDIMKKLHNDILAMRWTFS